MRSMRCSMRCKMWGNTILPCSGERVIDMERLFQPADIPICSCTSNWSARTLGGGNLLGIQKRGSTSATIALFLGKFNPFGVQVRS